MDLMKDSTSYAKLLKKYYGMEAPTFRISVEGTELVQKLRTAVTDVSVELTCGFEASGCSFTVLQEYDMEATGFCPDGAFKYLQIGARVELMVGYIVAEPVFSGYIIEVNYDFMGEFAPRIQVECADAKCLLMKSRRLEIMSEKKLSQAISALLEKKPVADYLKGTEVESLALEEALIHFPTESDYDFLVRYARYTGCEFFIIQGKAYFRKGPASTSPVMVLSFKEGLLKACANLRGAKLVKEVQVAGINPENGEAVLGSAEIKGTFSAGSTAVKSMDSTVRTYFDERVKSIQDAGDRAKILMEELQGDFMTFTGVCQGIPELAPGRYVQIQSLEPSLDKDWYIETVRHTVDERGFMTNFRARRDSL